MIYKRHSHNSGFVYMSYSNNEQEKQKHLERTNVPHSRDDTRVLYSVRNILFTNGSNGKCKNNGKNTASNV